jgi:energy-coupling factor transporter ATP-binding protein EcfA2
MTYLKAPSGTGKTTLAKCIAGLLPADYLRMNIGKVILTERTPRQFWRKKLLGKWMTMSFQHADESLSMRSTVEGIFDGLPKKVRGDRRSMEVLLGLLFDPSEVGSLRGRSIRTLSGGQKQKLNLLRCLSLETAIIILDEPLNGLDLASAKRVLALIRQLKEKGNGFLVISHNEEIFDIQADEVLFLRQSPAEGEEAADVMG